MVNKNNINDMKMRITHLFRKCIYFYPNYRNDMNLKITNMGISVANCMEKRQYFEIWCYKGWQDGTG